MVPPSAAAAQSNGAPAHGESKPQVDYAAVIEECAARKSAIGQTFVGKQGKQHLFASACANVKSRLGIPKFLDDGKTPTRLDSVHTDAILDAMRDFWTKQANRILNYGEIRSASFDKPSAEFVKVMDAAGNLVKTKAVPKLNAKIHAQKDCGNDAESALMLAFLIAQAKKRVDYMQGIITPGGNQSSAGVGKYDREEVDKAKAKLAILEASKAEYAADAVAKNPALRKRK